MEASASACPDLQGNMRVAATDGQLEFRVKSSLTDPLPGTRPTHIVHMEPLEFVVFDNVALGKCLCPKSCLHRLEHQVPEVKQDTITIILPTTAQDPAMRITPVVDPHTDEVLAQAWMQVLDRANATPPTAAELAAAKKKVADWLHPVLQKQVRPRQTAGCGVQEHRVKASIAITR
jgi:hypothetical protein